MANIIGGIFGSSYRNCFTTYIYINTLQFTLKTTAEGSSARPYDISLQSHSLIARGRKKKHLNLSVFDLISFILFAVSSYVGGC